jgi:RNA polymerase sigma-70 factor (ECF subfamily)
MSEEAPAAGGGEFPTTAWSVVLSAGQGSGKALENLFARYRPVVVHIVTWFRRTNRLRDGDAEDYAQEFLVHVMTHREAILGGADPQKGRFRTWLRACLKNWLRTRAEGEAALKRGGGATVISLEAEESIANGALVGKDDLEGEFDRRWAQDVLARAIARLREDERTGMLEEGDSEVFDLKHGQESLSAPQIAARLARPPNEIIVSLRRALRRLREHLQNEVSPTIATEKDFRAEIEDLFAAFGG